jgi:hypothetical protein
MSYKEMGAGEKESCLERNKSNMRYKYHAMALSDKKTTSRKKMYEIQVSEPF